MSARVPESQNEKWSARQPGVESLNWCSYYKNAELKLKKPPKVDEK